MRKEKMVESEGRSYKKIVILPEKIYSCDLKTFVQLATIDLAQRRALHVKQLNKKYLIAYNMAEEKRIFKQTGLRIYNVIHGIVITEVSSFEKFIRFDPHDQKLLEYSSIFDTKKTYLPTTEFIDIECLPTETDDLVINHIFDELMDWTRLELP